MRHRTTKLTQDQATQASQTASNHHIGLVGSCTLPLPLSLRTLLPSEPSAEPEPEPEPDPEAEAEPSPLWWWARAKWKPGGPRNVEPGVPCWPNWPNWARGWFDGTTVAVLLSLPGRSSSLVDCVKPDTSLSMDDERPLDLCGGVTML